MVSRDTVPRGHYGFSGPHHHRNCSSRGRDHQHHNLSLIEGRRDDLDSVLGRPCLLGPPLDGSEREGHIRHWLRGRHKG